MQDFYRCDLGYEENVSANMKMACKRLVHDMIYEAKPQAIVQYYAQYHNMKVPKNDAITMDLDYEQYLRVIMVQY